MDHSSRLVRVQKGAESAGYPELPLTLTETGWLASWFVLSTVGSLLILGAFLLYVFVEQRWLESWLSPDLLRVLHTWVGAGVAVATGTFVFVLLWLRMRRYDHLIRVAYGDLRTTVVARTVELQEANVFSETLFDVLPYAVVIVDSGCRIVRANRMAMSISGGSALVGEPCTAFPGTAAASPDECVAVDAMRARESIVNKVERCDPKTGQVFAVDSYPIWNRQGEVSSALVVARDVTAVKSFEANLREQEKLASLGVLAAGIAHDIANPLSSILIELALLKDEKVPQEVAQSLSILEEQVERMARTVEEMTGFARRRSERAAAVDIPLAIQDAMRMVRYDARAARTSIVVRVATAVPKVHMVEDYLVRVFVNLFINAFDAMPEGGALEITLEMEEDGARVEISDTGVGMSEAVRARAFEPLFTTKAPGKGTGLGLPVCRDIMAAIGGTLRLESAEGQGTKVILTFPRAALIEPQEPAVDRE